MEKKTLKVKTTLTAKNLKQVSGGRKKVITLVDDGTDNGGFRPDPGCC